MNMQMERRRILVVDDNDAIHTDFRKTLVRECPSNRLAAAAAMLFGESREAAAVSPSFDVESAMQGQQGLEKVEHAIKEGRPYAMAFVDMRMPPGWDGVETIQHLWNADPDLQVVICTAYCDYSWEQIITTLGATDRLLILKKPFDPMEVCQLATALTEKWKLKHQAALKLEELEKMVHQRTTELRKAALSDKLTGLPNRACFEEMLRRAAAGAEPGTSFAVFFIDFDRFKLINDSLGHKVGDELLTAIANRLRAVLGQSDAVDCEQAACVAARLAGDEFVVLQKGIRDAGQTTQLAESLLATFNAPYTLGAHTIRSTASIGIARSDHAYTSAENLLRDADSAMYRAKSTGKNRYAFFTPDMIEEAVAKVTLEADIHRALQQRQFELHYQPIVSLLDASLIGFEALVRWNHPRRGVIAPGAFIPLAEETGLIIPLGRWILGEALRQLRAWSDQFPQAANLTMSVNCSRKQFADPGFVALVTEMLRLQNIAPHRVNLEVTESLVMTQPDEMRRIMSALRSSGLRLHMDDFGTGYSSLNCLHSLPMDALKIDRSFIHNVSLRRDYAAIIQAIVSLAHNLNMKVISEGVETADQAAMLCTLECDQAQGYFFARPQTGEEAAAFIRGRGASLAPAGGKVECA